MKRNRRNKSDSRHPTSVHWILKPLFAALLVVVATLVAYGNTLHHGFVYDDIEGILNNPLIAGFESLSQVWHFTRETWRPVTQLSYALTKYLFGFDARAFHGFNILIHAANSLLVYGIALACARLWLPAERSGFFALAAALVFAVHPLHSEAVAYVWGRSSSLCATFYFGSLFMAMAGHRAAGRRTKSLWYAGAVVAGLLAWKAKEEAITLPLAVAGFFILAGSWRSAVVPLLMPAVVVAARWSDIFRLYSEVGENRALVSAGALPALSPGVYFLTHVKNVVFYYLRRFVIPFGLNVDPSIEPVTGPLDPLLVAAMIILLALAGAAVLAARRQPALALGLLTLLVSPLASYSVMPLADVVAEHRAYIAGLGMALMAGCALSCRPRRAPVLLALLAASLGWLTIQRNAVWGNSLALWKDAAEKSPGLARPHLNLGLALQAEGQAEEALEHYRRALAINPGLALAHINMSAILFSRGDVAGAEDALEKAVELSPTLISPYINLAIIALRQSRPADALRLLEKAESIEDYYVVHFNKGEAFFQLGRYREALAEYDRAIALKPDDRDMADQVLRRRVRLQEMGITP